MIIRTLLLVLATSVVSCLAKTKEESSQMLRHLQVPRLVPMNPVVAAVACPRGVGVQMFWDDFEKCQSAKIACFAWQELFSTPHCGCGCKPRFCGGIAGIQCGEGAMCVDNPNDNCDTNNGGADCGGICVEDKSCPTNIDYKSREPQECARMLITCQDGSTPYSDSRCGCGCKKADKVPTTKPMNCPKGTGYKYVSTNPKTCQEIKYSCKPGWKHFSNPKCGCGCFQTDATRAPFCPKGEGVSYASHDFPQCRVQEFACTSPKERFNIKGCGCGCQECGTGSNIRYKYRDPNECRNYRPSCKAGTRPFSNSCGCGCIKSKIVTKKPTRRTRRRRRCPTGGVVRYVSKDYSSCRRERFACTGGMIRFALRGCGCGCRCARPSKGMKYISRDQEKCATVRIQCDPGYVPFSTECGCGCKIQPVSPGPIIHPAPKPDWSVLVGRKCKEARAELQRSEPNLEIICIVKGTPLTADIIPNRVRILTNDQGIVLETPKKG